MIVYHLSTHNSTVTICKTFNILLNRNRLRGGENRMKTGVKLACKTVFIRFSTSGERPSLCSAKPDKKMPVKGNEKTKEIQVKNG